MGGDWSQYGKYPAKVYTIDGVLIYQVDNGSDNTGKSPLGGVVAQSLASSMLNTIANPIIYYGNPVVNQAGHSGDLYNYYWTSYSRGTDGTYPNNTNWHNAYLDGYIPLRVKSIYDPCPYLYRIPSNGIYNQFGPNAGWTWGSYLAGASWNINTLDVSWFLGLGERRPDTCNLGYLGVRGNYYSSTSGDQVTGYVMEISAYKSVGYNNTYGRSHGLSVRCIEGFNVTFRTGISATVQHSSCKHDSAFTLHDIGSPKRH